MSHSHTTVCLYMGSTWCISFRLYIHIISTVVNASKSLSLKSCYNTLFFIFLLCVCDHVALSLFSKQLDHRCKEREGELYCLRCYDNMVSAICGACRYIIRTYILAAQWSKNYLLDTHTHTHTLFLSLSPSHFHTHTHTHTHTHNQQTSY